MSNPKIMAAFDYIIVINSEDGIKNITPYLSMWLNVDLTGWLFHQGNDVGCFVG
jgi:hypothetical protein